MGVFDLFGKNSKTDSSSTIKERNNKIGGHNAR